MLRGNPESAGCFVNNYGSQKISLSNMGIIKLLKPIHGFQQLISDVIEFISATSHMGE